MNYEDYYNLGALREKVPIKKDQKVSFEVLANFFVATAEKSMLLEMNDPTTALFLEYAANKGTEKEKIFNQLLKDYNFNWQFSIHNAIYELLLTEKEKNGKESPMNWPGINYIEGSNNCYILDTVLGDIEVYKASEILKNTPHYHIFKKKLSRMCYLRTYDFISESDEYKAVLFYQPAVFNNGHYHAYLENDEAVLDIAANALYYSKESATKVLTGEKLATLSYEQINQEFDSIKSIFPEEYAKDKLFTLTLYHDMHR